MTTTNRLSYTASKDMFKAVQPLKSMLKYYWLMIAKIIYAMEYNGRYLRTTQKRAFRLVCWWLLP
ncbi:MAG: hypothetical protein ACLRTD_22265 [Bacteroides sp.]